MNNNKKQFFGMNIGSASMILIFVVLCLISFAALSIVSANADSRLSQKIADRTTAYYEACNLVQEELAELDQELKTQYLSSSNADIYFSTVGHEKSYEIPITDLQTLFVEVEILYPENAGDSFYQITGWKTNTYQNN